MRPSGPGTTIGSKAPVSSPGSVMRSHDTPPSRLMKAALVRVARLCAEALGKLHPPVWVTAIRKSGLSGLAAIHGSLNPPGATRRLGPTMTSGVWAVRWPVGGVVVASAAISAARTGRVP